MHGSFVVALFMILVSSKILGDPSFRFPHNMLEIKGVAL